MKRLLLLITVAVAICSATRLNAQNMEYKNTGAAFRLEPLTDVARRNHELWWPGYKSAVKQTDPDLIEVFDNFAFDDVMNHGTLDMKTRALITAASNIAVGAVSEYRMTIRASLNLGATPVEVKEVLYQAVPYVGIARPLDFIHATNDELAARGVKLPLESV